MDAQCHEKDTRNSFDDITNEIDDIIDVISDFIEYNASTMQYIMQSAPKRKGFAKLGT